MKRCSTLALAVSLVLSPLLPAVLQAKTGAAPIAAMWAYVPTDDVARSTAFYAAIFDRAPAIALPDFVTFRVADGWFAVVSRARYAPDATPGTGAVPYLQSGDLEALQDRVGAAGARAPAIIEEPGIRILKITDPYGQLIQFFQITAQQGLPRTPTRAKPQGNHR